MPISDESYREFLNRVHADDVAQERALHKPGDCSICDHHRRSADTEHPQKG